MMIKVPDDFRPSDYGIELSIPKPVMECRKNDDGSFSMYAGYSCDMSDFAREAAREMNDKMEAELIDELLRMNGYVPERTCREVGGLEYDDLLDIWTVKLSCGHVVHPSHNYVPAFCEVCGAKVVE